MIATVWDDIHIPEVMISAAGNDKQFSSFSQREITGVNLINDWALIVGKCGKNNICRSINSGFSAFSQPLHYF